MSFKGLGDQITPEDQARKLEATSIVAGPPTGSGITLAAWRSWHECEFFVHPRRRTTCEKVEYKLASACLAREIGLDGNGAPLRRRARPKCGARKRQGEPCAVRASAALLSREISLPNIHLFRVRPPRVLIFSKGFSSLSNAIRGMAVAQR